MESVSSTMEMAEIVPIFLLVVSQVSAYTSTIIHLPDTQSTSPSDFQIVEESIRSPKQHPVTQNIYPSTNYIKSTFHQNDPQPQLFNVGYSVRFENQPKGLQQTRQSSATNLHYIKTQLNQGDIITGTRKQNVQVDSPVAAETSFRIQKDVQHRNMKTSQNNGISYSSKSLVGQGHVSPTTQRNLEILENLRDVDYQKELSELYQQKYTWKNLSPNVKIIKSTEVPTENIEDKPMAFDHAKALAKSEGFGFSDAIRDGIGLVNDETLRDISKSYKDNRDITSQSQKFQRTRLKEQVEEPSTTTPFGNDQELILIDQKVIVPQEVQVKAHTQPKLVQVLPQTIFQEIEEIPIKTHQQLPIQSPKQVIVQYKKIPVTQFESTKKFPAKIKYVKQVPTRGNVHYTRKYVTSGDFPRKTKMKPQLRRDFGIPSEYNLQF